MVTLLAEQRGDGGKYMKKDCSLRSRSIGESLTKKKPRYAAEVRLGGLSHDPFWVTAQRKSPVIRKIYY